MPENTVARIVEICKEKGVPVSRLEKDLGFGNGSLNPEKTKDLGSIRLFKILHYLKVSYEEFYGTPVEPLYEQENPTTDIGDGDENEPVDELFDYAFTLFNQLPIEEKISVIGQMQSRLQNKPTQDAPEESV